MINKAVAILKRGGVIAFPTETTYGLGCDPRNAKAVARIFAMKGRKNTRPLLLVGPSIAQIRRVAILSSQAMKLAKKHWPGPLTLVLPVQAKAGLVRPPEFRDEVAVRVSSSPIVQRLTRAYGFPIVATSANRSGEPDSRSGRAVRRAFAGHKDGPDLIIDVGRLPRRKPSTLAKIYEDGRIDVQRQGAIRV